MHYFLLHSHIDNIDNISVCPKLIYSFIYSLSIISTYYISGPILEVEIHGLHLPGRCCIIRSHAHVPMQALESSFTIQLQFLHKNPFNPYSLPGIQIKVTKMNQTVFSSASWRCFSKKDSHQTSNSKGDGYKYKVLWEQFANEWN